MRWRIRGGRADAVYRTGGAPSLALGMAKIFAGIVAAQALVGFWYHFAIMFEALFILTMLDAGTRVGPVHAAGSAGARVAKLGRTSGCPGMRRPALDGGDVGIFSVPGGAGSAGRHQFAVASVWHREPAAGGGGTLRGTTILIKMHGAKYMWVTCGPLVWLAIGDLHRGVAKDFRCPHRRWDFWRMPGCWRRALHTAATAALVFNDRLDAAVTGDVSGDGVGRF